MAELNNGLFFIPVCYLITLLIGDRIPFITMSDDATDASVATQLATVHGGLLWTPWMRDYLVKGTGAVPFYFLIAAYCAFLGFELYKGRSANLTLQIGLFAMIYYHRVVDFQSAPQPDVYATYLMCTSAVACFGGLVLFLFLSFGVEGLGLKPSAFFKRANDAQFWFLAVLMPLYGVADLWLRGHLAEGTLFNLWDYATNP